MKGKLLSGLAGIVLAGSAIAENERLSIDWRLGDAQSNSASLNYSDAIGVTTGFNSGKDKIAQLPAYGNSGAYIFQGSLPANPAYAPNNSTNRVALTYQGVIGANMPARLRIAQEDFSSPRSLDVRITDKSGSQVYNGTLTNLVNQIELPSPRAETSAAATPLFNIYIDGADSKLPVDVVNPRLNREGNLSFTVYNAPVGKTNTIQRTTARLPTNIWDNILTLNGVDSGYGVYLPISVVIEDIGNPSMENALYRIKSE